MKNSPHHVALILDGNRRWASLHHKLPLEGHRQGAHVVEKIIKHLRESGVHTITIWIFSTENWQREKTQVTGLLNLFEEFITTYFKKALKEKTRIVHLGRKDRLPESLKKKIVNLEAETAGFTETILNIALDYGGQDEIVRAIHTMTHRGIDPKTVTEEIFSSLLDTGNQPYPNPDIVIRTGGEMRTSGFLLWQAAYAELFILKKYLPDVSEEDIQGVLDEFAERQRRYGK